VQYPLQAPLSTTNEVREDKARIEGRTDRLEEESIMEHIILYERDRALTLPTSPLHEDIKRPLYQNPTASVRVYSTVDTNRLTSSSKSTQATPLTSLIPSSNSISFPLAALNPLLPFPSAPHPGTPLEH
jgi:hypothetical protein